jgi:DNA repair protein RecN (Recombination protein N)
MAPRPHSPGAQPRAHGGQLLELRIKDFAIIDELTLLLEPGLNALTGETGAGKSILIDALGAVLGDRASAGMIRAGAQRAIIEATFSRPKALPEEIEIDPADEVIILSRDIAANGRGAARLNGRTVPVSILQLAGRALVDVHGQSDHQSLLHPATHLLLLDRFAGLDAARESVAAHVRQLRQVRQELAGLQGDQRELARQQDVLRFQVDEIDAAALQEGEEAELAARRSVLANAEKLRQAAVSALSALNDDGGAVDRLLAAAKVVADAARLDARLSEEAAALDGAAAGLQDACRALARYLDGIDADPEELQRIDERLDLIRALRRKYGDSISDIKAYAERARAQLGDILGADERVQHLQADERRLLAEALERAGRLSAGRQHAAEALAAEVERQLGDLQMGGARFQAHVWPRQDDDALQATGIDEVEFLLAANRGEPLRPLAQVASGGEASRLMLALKSAFSAADETPVLVFDEIEAGVGARSGHVIGQKLRDLAASHQVLCITHLAPVAALANAHFRVRKLESGDRTTTTVDCLVGDERIEELAEMLAGKPISEAARTSARELLEGSPTVTAA